jgi:ABC-type glycerol-3-phosphate transport system substrate-binding protein/DNA-binding transcriptional regulator YhcF (GntR family)
MHEFKFVSAAIKVMKKKLTVTENIREYILELLENGKLRKGGQIPPARKIALKKGVSFIKVQHAIDSLCFDGILETVPRRGTFVKESWDSQRLRNSIFIQGLEMKKLIGLDKIIKEEISELRINKNNVMGDFEINVTLNMQTKHNEYMDLSEIFDELYPDKSIFYMKPFDHFIKGKKLYAIPLLCSPRVISFNIDMLKNAGCDVPDKNWTWDDFLALVKKLKTKYNPENIYTHYPFMGLNMLMAFIFRAGGGFLDERGNVIISSEKSRRGLLLYKSLLKELDYKSYDNRKDFMDGALVFSFSPRQEFMPRVNELKFQWGNVPLPRIPGGTPLTVQTTEGLCVHKSCSDLKLVKRVVKVMLSEKFQNCLAKGKYGIPIRKDVAERSIADCIDPRDKLFFDEIPNMSVGYSIESPEIHRWLHKGLNSLLLKDDAEFDRDLDALAVFLKKYIEMTSMEKRFKKKRKESYRQK